MPLDIGLCAVPHLKVLFNFQNIFAWQQLSSTFTLQKIHLKIPILLHTEQMFYSISARSVLTVYWLAAPRA